MRTATAVLGLFLVIPVAVAGQQTVKAFDPSARDTTCSPCKDFFQYANGGWVARTEIPAAYASWGTFTELDDRNKR